MMTPDDQHNSTPVAPDAADKDYIVVDMLGLIRTFYNHRWNLLAWVMTVTILAVLSTHFVAPGYRASVKFMPPKGPATSALASLVGGSRGGSTAEQYRAMLTSRTVADDVIQHQHLQTVFGSSDMDYARYRLSKMAAFEIDRNSFISIDVTADSGQQAADLANEFYAALYRLTESTAAKEAAHHLAFVTASLDAERKNLSNAEDQLRAVQERTGVLLPDAQTALGIQQVAQINQRISDLQAQLAVLRSGATDQSPQVVRLRTEIGSLQAKVQDLQGKSDQANAPSRMPGLALEVARATREVKYHTTLLDLLARSGESSRTDETYTPSLTLIDGAIAPRFPSTPELRKYVIISFMLSLVTGCLYVLLTASWRRWKRSSRGVALRQAAANGWKGGWV